MNISLQLENKHRELLRSASEQLRVDYYDEKASRARIACAVINDNLGDDVSFQAYYDLFRCGPKNDYNGLRSAAERIRKEWETRVLNPGLETARKFKANRA